MSSVWGMIIQWGSTIKVSMDLPVTTRHRRDMTEKLLKAMLNPNKQQQPPNTRRICPSELGHGDGTRNTGWAEDQSRNPFRVHKCQVVMGIC